MAIPHVGKLSSHYRSTRIPHKDIPDPSLGLDLRFEQTYLKNIAPYVRLTTAAPDESEKHGDVARIHGERLEINWAKVVWITTRDQVLAPLLQGLVWGTLSPWVQHFRGFFAWSSPVGRSTSRTGAGIVKLKSWLSSIIPRPATASFRTK